MIKILFFVLCFVKTLNSHTVHGILKDDLELERQLEAINKPPVKSIQTEFGYIVDCIDIYKQPAFDHPLLKDHKLQRKSSFRKSSGKTSVKNSSGRHIFGLQKDQCPTGTVPIRRTTKDDIIRSRSLSNNDNKLNDFPDAYKAEVYLLSFFSPYYKVKGQNSVYNPRVLRKDQTSISHIWLQNGPDESTNKISLGWHVVPQVYGDSATYLYSSWTTDNYKKTGCYNVQCSGFVQTDKANYIGGRVSNTSTYGGTMVECTISITQDPVTKNWWLSIEEKDIGYYPARLFSNMTSADQVGWGGRTVTPLGTPSPQMGSGYFPDNNFVHACYFRYISFQNESRIDYGPEDYMADTFNDKPDCFGVTYYGDQGGEVGYSLQFGGPGGQC